MTEETPEADCVVPELEAGTSFDDLLQAIAKTIERMRIIMLKRFIQNLLISMSVPFDNPSAGGVAEEHGLFNVAYAG